MYAQRITTPFTLLMQPRGKLARLFRIHIISPPVFHILGSAFAVAEVGAGPVAELLEPLDTAILLDLYDSVSRGVSGLLVLPDESDFKKHVLGLYQLRSPIGAR